VNYVNITDAKQVDYRVKLQEVFGGLSHLQEVSFL
jgi:hypothetical protein